jgi:NOL1/NOP2/fmu family ribosome biogenesis protein
LKNSLKTIFAGTILGEIKGKDLIPAHAASMSVALNEKAFPCYELNEKAALDYLRKETGKAIPSELSQGYVLITYENCPLGFIKNIGIRINNLYPQEWRIIKI